MPAYLYPVFKYFYDREKNKNDYVLPRKVQEIPQQRQNSEQVNMDREELFYEEYLAREKKMLDRVDIDFVETFREVCKFYGWSGDYIEIIDFFRHVVGLLGEDIQLDDYSIAPYWYDEEMLRMPVEQMNYQELQDEWRELATVAEAN